MNGPPERTEAAPYYFTYIDLIPDIDIVGALEKQVDETSAFLSGISEEQSLHRYAPDKWSVKEVLGHVADTERIFAYRALRIARGDQTPLSGFEQDDYVRGARFGARPLADVVEEYADVRQASLALFGSLDDGAWLRRGVANGNPVTVLALAYLMAGHELHHRKILEERYFPAIPRA